MRGCSDWLAVGALPLALALPLGVHVTASALESGRAHRLAVGLPLLAAGVLGLECGGRAADLLRAECGRPPAGRAEWRPGAGPVVGPDLVMALLLQVITVLMYGAMLDGHVHLRACAWVYLVYAAWAAPVLAWHKGAPTGWGRRYVRSGWAVAIAFALPVALPGLQTVGLAPFRPIQW
jgi:hypothetical protein